MSDEELAEQGYRVLCWTCDYSSCQCRAFDNMPKLVFSRPLPRNSKGLPMIRPLDRVILPAGTVYEAWRTDVEVGEGRRHPTMTMVEVYARPTERTAIERGEP